MENNKEIFLEELSFENYLNEISDISFKYKQIKKLKKALKDNEKIMWILDDPFFKFKKILYITKDIYLISLPVCLERVNKLKKIIEKYFEKNKIKLEEVKNNFFNTYYDREKFFFDNYKISNFYLEYEIYFIKDDIDIKKIKEFFSKYKQKKILSFDKKEIRIFDLKDPSIGNKTIDVLKKIFVELPNLKRDSQENEKVLLFNENNIIISECNETEKIKKKVIQQSKPELILNENNKEIKIYFKEINETELKIIKEETKRFFNEISFDKYNAENDYIKEAIHGFINKKLQENIVIFENKEEDYEIDESKFINNGVL